MNVKASLPLVAVILVLMVGHGIKDASAQTGGSALPIAKAIHIAHPLSLSTERNSVALNSQTDNFGAAPSPTLPNDGANPNIPGLPDNGANPGTLDATAIVWGILGGILAVLIVIFFFAKKVFSKSFPSPDSPGSDRKEPLRTPPQKKK